MKTDTILTQTTNYNFNLYLNNVKSIERNTLPAFALAIDSFFIDIESSLFINKLISIEEFENNAAQMTYVIKAVKADVLSYHMKNTLISITSILVDAKLLNNIGQLSEAEFIQILMKVRATFFQKAIIIKKAFLKKQIQDKGINKNSLSVLRAKVATLESDN